MKMTVLYFEYKNIRKFNDLKISFVDKNGNPIKNTFLMMGNGTGKTTSMTLIKGLLDGTATEWSPEEIRSYAPINQSIKEGYFSISVKFDEKQYIYKLTLNYEKATTKIETTAKPKGKENGLVFPDFLDGVFSPEFVRRFVFDGEQAEKSLDSRSNEAEETIKYLYRLDKLDEILALNNKILKDVQTQASDGGQNGSDISISSYRTKRYNAQKELNALISKQSNLNRECDRVNHSLNVKKKQRDKLDKNNKSLNEEKVKIEKQQEENSGKIELKTSEILSILMSPSRVSKQICDDMVSLGQNMKKLKLPKSISKDFFTELAETNECICGRHIGEKEKDAILKNAEKYLGSDQQAILNEIKGSLMSSEFDDALTVCFTELKELLEEELRLNQKHITNEEKLLKAGGKDAQDLQEAIARLSEELGGYKTELARIESTDESDSSLTSSNNIAKAKQKVDEYDKKIASATKTHVALKRKEIVESLIQKIKTTATNSLKKEIIEKTNEKLSVVITDDLIEVENIDKFIMLKGKDGASEGQTLSIAYCFLGTLFEDSELEFPFIIDSPCGSMDLSKRKAIAEIVPKVFNQLIAFVTSAEVDQFANQFYNNNDTQFVTIIASVNSDDIDVHNGKDFFDSYQREHKEEQ